jgi:hypothetical protein
MHTLYIVAFLLAAAAAVLACFDRVWVGALTAAALAAYIAPVAFQLTS